jgi:RNA polymerase sigma-70 factor (ECF subfamily)
MAHDSTTQLQHWIDRMNAGDDAGRTQLLSHSWDRLRRLTRKMLGDYPRVHRFEETDDVLDRSWKRLNRALENVHIANVREFFRLSDSARVD